MSPPRAKRQQTSDAAPCYWWVLLETRTSPGARVLLIPEIVEGGSSGDEQRKEQAWRQRQRMNRITVWRARWWQSRKSGEKQCGTDRRSTLIPQKMVQGSHRDQVQSLPGLRLKESVSPSAATTLNRRVSSRVPVSRAPCSIDVTSSSVTLCQWIRVNCSLYSPSVSSRVTAVSLPKAYTSQVYGG